MDPRKTAYMTRPDVTRPGRPDFQQGSQKNRETAFFAALKGATVAAETMDGRKISGKLVWAGRYSLIIEQNGNEVLYWKHALKSIRIANGRGDD